MARILVALTLLLAPSSVLAQDAQNGPAQKIRVSTRLVQIGVIVHDKQGPADGLSKDDFAIYDRGKRQTISFFSVASSGAAAWPAEQLPPNTFSDLAKYNPAAPGSITIVLLDNLNTLYGYAPTVFEDTPSWMEDHALANAKAHLLDYLHTLGPHDRVALYGLGDTLHVLCDFTTDRSQLLAIVGKYDVHSRTNREIVEPRATRLPQQAWGLVRPPIDEASKEHAATANEARATITLMALKAIADHLANVPGRKNLVWLTANLPFSPEAMAAILGPAQIAAYPIDSRGLLPLSTTVISVGGMDSAQPGLPEQIREAFTNPSRSLEPTGVETMQQVADLTGGRAFVNSNDLTGAIRDAVDDAAGLYSLGFYIDEHAADGQFHEIKVAVARSGVTVRHPKAYFASKESPSTQNDVHNNLITAVRSPIESSAIPLQASIERVNDPAPNSLRIIGSIDLHEVRLAEKGKLHEGAVDVIIVEQDASGKVLSQSVNHLKLRFTDEKYALILNSGVRFEKHLQPKPEDTTLRILVEDSTTAQVGSLIIPLSAVK